MKISCPCKDCEEREMKCHVNCDKYKQYQKEMQSRKQHQKDVWQSNRHGRRSYIKNMPAELYFIRLYNKQIKP